MYKIFILMIFTTFLNASNPTAYAILGDVIYDNVNNIKKLEALEAYSVYKDEIKTYVTEVQKTKEKGFVLETSQDAKLKKEYLTKLRKLSKQNDFFVRSVQTNYENSLQEGNSLLFSQLINSGLVDTQKYKKEIVDYYFNHSEDINATGIIQTYLDEDEQLKKRKNAQIVKQKTKKTREAEKIKRIRENDIQAQKILEEKLQEEVNKKKLEIRKNQKRELSK